MVKAESILRLIVIDDSSNDVDTVSSMLRSAGYAVRSERAEDDEDLRTLLTQHNWDMVLSKPSLPYLNAAETLHIIQQMRLDVPLILLTHDAADEAAMLDLLAAGGRDVVSATQPALLMHAILREFHDLHHRRRLQQCEGQLAEANQRAQALVDSSRDAIAYVHEGMYIYTNHSYLERFGYSDPDEIAGTPLMDMVVPADHAQVKEFLRTERHADKGPHTLQVQGRHANGHTMALTMELSPAVYEGETCFQIMIRSGAGNHELEQRLDSLSKQDLLTGVSNRTHFITELGKEMSRPEGYGAVFYMAPDDFKHLRERFGLSGSDHLLSEFARTLQQHLESTGSLLARFDAHMFTAMLPGVDAITARQIAQHLMQAVGEHIFDVGNQTASLTCSIGIALYYADTHDLQENLSRAEKAWKRAITIGGNNLHLHDPHAEGAEQRELLAMRTQQIKRALRDNQFRLYYQPVVSLHGDARENYEVLLRMLAEDGQPIPPGEFIQAAEQGNLITAIDRWVLAHVVRALAEHRRANRSLNFFIKLSAGSLKDDSFLPWLHDLLKSAGMDGSHLILEVSEHVASSNLKSLKRLIDALHQLRVRLALDHFGLAPNATNLLRHCNADFLKIDGSLIRGIGQEAAQQQKVKEITQLARENSKQTIAEFVEDANTLATLWSCGLDYIQGYFLQEPGPEMNFDFSSLG